VGAALAYTLRNGDNVAVAFLGEGAANQGAFHESLNLAAVWKVPVVFVIEDNSYGISVSKRDCTAVARNSDRAAAYGMPGYHVPGNDPDTIYEVAGKAIAAARSGLGPSLIEIETTRLEGHFMGDGEGYRPDGEVARLRQIDPIPRYRERLLSDGFDAADLDAAEKQARSEVEQAFLAARQAAYPAPEEAFDHVFA
jgi:acetoin:2,6-dichlorophenolindophenol oxidoreductase subunit alpha